MHEAGQEATIGAAGVCVVLQATLGGRANPLVPVMTTVSVVYASPKSRAGGSPGWGV